MVGSPAKCRYANGGFLGVEFVGSKHALNQVASIEVIGVEERRAKRKTTVDRLGALAITTNRKIDRGFGLRIEGIVVS